MRDAIQHASAALKLNTDSSAANLFIGASYLELGQHTNAITPLQRVLAVTPSDRNARLMLAEALSGAAGYEEAIKQFRSAAEVLPSSSRVWYGLGQVYDALAKQACQEVESKFPDSAYAWALAGDSYLRERRFESAIRHIVISGQRAGGSGRACGAGASVYSETGHPDWAEKEQGRKRHNQGTATITASRPFLLQCKADRSSGG